MAYVSCNSSLILNPGSGGGGSTIQLFEVLANGNNAQGRNILGVGDMLASGIVESNTIVSTGLATLHRISTTEIQCSGAVTALNVHTTGGIICDGGFLVGGDLTAEANATVVGDLGVNGDVDIVGDMQVAGLGVTNNLVVGGNCNITGTLTTTGAYTPASLTTGAVICTSLRLNGSALPVNTTPIYPAVGSLRVEQFVPASFNFASGVRSILYTYTLPAGIYSLKVEADAKTASVNGGNIKIEIVYKTVLTGFSTVFSQQNTQTCCPTSAYVQSDGSALGLFVYFTGTSADGASPYELETDSDIDILRVW